MYWEIGGFITENIKNNRLLVIWSSSDREVALKMVFMYTRNAMIQGWWDNVRLIIWGPSSKLLSEDDELQAYIKNMRDSGVEVMACKACTDSYGISSLLEELGIQVIYMGEPLTSMLKDGWTTLTF